MPYWYLSSDGKDPYDAVSLDERINYYESPLSRDTSRIEGEDMDIVSATAGSVTVQDMQAFGAGWSNNKHLFWYKNNLSDVGPHSSAIATFPVKATAQYSVKAVMTQAADYGSVQLYLDNSAIGSAIDCYNDGVTRTPELTLGTRALTQGTHELKVVINGKNNASSAHYFGLDYLKLVPVPVSAESKITGAAIESTILNIARHQGSIRFTVSPSIRQVCIYDVAGSLVRTMMVRNGIAVWSGANVKGTYIVRVQDGKRTNNRQFVIID
jgi:hypothetical protein